MAPVTNDAVQGGWQVTPLEKNAELWLRIAADEPTNGLNQLNGFRSVRNAALVRNQGSLEPSDEAELQRIVKTIDESVPNSFESHLAKFYLLFPGPEAFEHLDIATSIDKDRSEVIGPQLVNSARSWQATGSKKWAMEMKARGDVAPGLWLLAEDILNSVDGNGVLFAAGEMDAYPMWVKQYTEGFRQDVLVLDHRLLVDAGYRQRGWQACGAKGTPPSDPDRFITQLVLATDRPVFLSMALGPDKVRGFSDDLQVTGLAMRYGKTTEANIPLLEQRWKQMNKAVNAGPLARNYLVPGSLLLKHYRTVGNEAGSSRMEHELRSMAKTLGATDRLYRAGILEH